MLQRAMGDTKFKRYVSVVVHYPMGLDQSHAEVIRIKFRNGSVWQVDRTYKGYWAAAQKAGGRGMLYPILVTPKVNEECSVPPQQREMHLFHDDNEWFVELDEPEETEM